MSLFLISCGGTGGHLSPGIALAERLVARGHAVRLLISLKKVDARLIEKYPQFEFLRVPGTGFSWSPRAFARCLVSQVRGLFFCLRLVRHLRPDALVGFGGFTSTGVVVAARWHGVPVMLHEANRVPGRAVRLLGRLAQRVCLPAGIAIPGIRPGVTRHVGLPVRSEIARVPQAAARAALGFDPDSRLLVVLGGSQGATALNAWVEREFPRLAAAGLQVACVTGLGKGAARTIEAPTAGGGVARARFIPFCDRVGDLLSAADLVVSRAGAGTIAELIRCATPAILVPYPQAADNHQRANAAFFAQQGGGLMLEQTALSELSARVSDTIFDAARMREFRDSLERMDRENSIDPMIADLERFAAPPSAGLHADPVPPSTLT
jgi:UDP-N-acetylglucosamine--N-acetylmuramyl-(pentapeptide) pyrophosphoryl-undecaprenol N-acetylglucosamine transferase